MGSPYKAIFEIQGFQVILQLYTLFLNAMIKSTINSAFILQVSVKYPLITECPILNALIIVEY